MNREAFIEKLQKLGLERGHNLNAHARYSLWHKYTLWIKVIHESKRDRVHVHSGGDNDRMHTIVRTFTDYDEAYQYISSILMALKLKV